MMSCYVMTLSAYAGYIIPFYLAISFRVKCCRFEMLCNEVATERLEELTHKLRAVAYLVGILL